MNHKRVRRLWRDEGLRVVHSKRKQPLRGAVQVGGFCPIRPNVLWALDFQFDQTADAQDVEAVERDRRTPASAPPSSLIAASTPTRSSPPSIGSRSSAAHLRICASITELSSSRRAVADSCRFNTTTMVFIDPGSRSQNAWIESFNGRLRDELLKLELVRERTPRPRPLLLHH